MLADHNAGTNIGDLLLHFQELLRKRVDLQILLVDLFREVFELSVCLLAGRERLRTGGAAQSGDADEDGKREQER